MHLVFVEHLYILKNKPECKEIMLEERFLVRPCSAHAGKAGTSEKAERKKGPMEELSLRPFFVEAHR